MSEVLTLTPEDLALAVNAEAHKPVTKTQQNMSREVATYMRKFVRLHPNFYWDQRIDRHNAVNEMGRIWPDKDAGNEAVARLLQQDIADVIAAAPISKANPMVLVRIWAVSSRSEASLTPVKTVPQPNQPVVIAPFDGLEGSKIRYFVPVFNELPTFKDMAIDFGLMVLCQAVPPLISQFSDNRPIGLGGGGGNMYGERSRDKILAGNDSADPEAIVNNPFNETYFMHLPIPTPPAQVPPWETSPTLLSSQVMEGTASMAALGLEESSVREHDQTRRAARREQEQTVAAVTRQATPSLGPVIGAAGVAALAQEAAAAQTGMPLGVPQASVPQTEFGEAATRPILRDLPALDDPSLSPTDRATIELQLEQEAVREARDAGEITSSEAVALDRMPNAYSREQMLETEEQHHLPEAYLEGDEPGLRAAGQEILAPEGAVAENDEEANTEANLGEGNLREDRALGESAVLAAERGGEIEAASGAEGTPVGEALSEAQGEVLGQTEPENEPVLALSEPSAGNEIQQEAAAEITGETVGGTEPQLGAESVVSEPTIPESANVERTTPAGEDPSVGSPDGEQQEPEQEQHELSLSADEVTEPQANATVPDPVRVSGETHRHETPDPDITKSEASMQDVKNEVDDVRDKMPDTNFHAGHEEQVSHVSEGHRESLERDDHSDQQNQPIHHAGIQHPVIDTAVEQGGSHVAHQLDQMHQAAEGGSVAPHMHPDAGVGHDVPSPQAYHSLTEGGLSVPHHAAFSPHPAMPHGTVPEQSVPNVAHQMDQLHHAHEAMEGSSFVPHMRHEVGLAHGAHTADAYRSLPQPAGSGVPHNAALSSHPLTPPVLVSTPLRTSRMIQRMQPALGKTVTRDTKVAAKSMAAGKLAPAAIISAAAMKTRQRPLSAKATPKPAFKPAATVKAAASQSKRKPPVASPTIKVVEPPTPEPGGL